MILRNSFFTFVFLILGHSFASSSLAQMGKIDTKHVSDKSIAVLRIDFKEVLKQVKKDSPDVQRVAGMLKNQLSIDLFGIDAITLQIGMPNDQQGKPTFAATIEFSKAIDKDSLLQRIRGGAAYEDVEYKGKKYKKATNKFDPCLYIESGKKLTLSSPDAIKDIIDAASGMGSNASRLKAIPTGSELAVIVSKTEDFEKNKRQLLNSLGIPVDGVMVFLSSAQSGFFYINSTSGVPLRLNCTFDEAEVARNARESLEGLVTFLKASAPAAKETLETQIAALKDAEGGFVAMQRSAMEKGLVGIEIGEKLLAGVEVKVKGETVDLQAKHMGGIKGAGDLLFFGLQMFVLGSSDMEAAPPAELKAEDFKKVPEPRKK